MYGLDAVTVWICRLTSKRIPIINIPDNSVHGANMGPIWDRKGPGGPHVGPINLDIWDSTVVRPSFRTPHAVNTGWRQIDIHGCYLTVKIRFGPICASKNNWGIWWHDTRTSRLRDVKGQLWWRHNDKVGLCVQGIRQCVRNKKKCMDYREQRFLSLVRRFGNDFNLWVRHLWKLLPNRLTRDKKICIHCNPYIILYIFTMRIHIPGRRSIL